MLVSINCKLKAVVWAVLLGLIFIRPFLSEQAFMSAGLYYISIFSAAAVCFLFAEKINPFSNALNLCVFLFMALIVYSSLFAKIVTTSLLVNLYEPLLFLPNVLMFYIAGKINRRQRQQLVSTVFLAAGIIGIYSIYQYFIGFQHTLDYISNTRGLYREAERILLQKRVYATFVSPNLFAGYIVIILFWIMGYLLDEHALSKKTIYISIAGILMLLSLIFTKSFGGLLSFVAGFLIFLFYLERFFWAAVAGLFASFAGFFIFNMHRMADFANSITQRFYYWMAGVNIVKDFPLMGVGWRKFGVVYDFYKPPAANESHYAHNVFVQIAAETGFPGLVCFLALLIAFFMAARSILKNKTTARPGLKIGLFCSACSFLILNLVDLSFYFGQAAFFWWMVLGLLINEGEPE